MHLARTRSLFILAFFACCLIVGAAVYLEDKIGMLLSPFCSFQRGLYLGFGVVCLLAAIHTPSRRIWRTYSAVLVLVSSVGACVAGRQVWLQGFPPENLDSCLENLRYLLDTQSYFKVLGMTFAGDAGCAQINWTLFGISVPEWSLLGFSALTLFALYFFFIEFRPCRSIDAGTAD